MKKLAIHILFFMYSLNAYSLGYESECTHWLPLFKPICQRFNQIWTEGKTDLYLSGYAWHNRYIYSQEKIHSYNENAWGGGLGKSIFDEKGNWQGLYAIAFLDSHKDLEPAIGYAYLKVLDLGQQLKAGLGYSLLLSSRSDINHFIPFPGLVPWGSLFFQKISISAAYIPGNSTNGNVLYVVGRYTF